jgi:hypothetical protein
LGKEVPKIVSLEILTQSHVNQITWNDGDILELKGRLDTEEPKPKVVSLETLTQSHMNKIASNDRDISAL